MLYLLISCKIYENKKHGKEEEVDKEQQYSEQHQLLYTARQDTHSRLWYFGTDSPFRFHPDSGLFARSGGLLLQESEKRISKQLQVLAGKKAQEKQKEVNRKNSSTKMLSLQHLWIAGSFLLLFLLWRWGRSRLLH